MPNFLYLSNSYLSKVASIRSEQIIKFKIFPLNLSSINSYENLELKHIALLLGIVQGVVVQEATKIFSEEALLKIAFV